MVAIETERISKTYAGAPRATPALVEFSLEVESGQALALLGPNGAGKSTVIRIFSTLARPDSGRASIFGFDLVEQAPQVRTCIGVALQEVGLYPAGRVRQVLAHHARLFGLNRSAASRRCDEVLEITGLTKVSGQHVSRLSGGIRRRLDLGLALVHKPPVLLLDEPTGSLDPFSRRELWGELARLRDEGTCILFASQNLEEAEQLADRVVVLIDGAIWRNNIPAAVIREFWGSDDLAITP